MKTRYSYKIILLLILFAGEKYFGQDVHFSQYGETPLSVNPALAGVNYNTRAIANYKSQWSSVANPYTTYGFSFDQTLKHKKLKDSYFAVFATVYKDIAGDSKLSKLNPNFGINYIQRVSKDIKLSGGVQSGFMYQTIDASSLRFDRQYNGYSYDPSLPNGEANLPKSSITSFDLGGGFNFNYVQSRKFASAQSPLRFDAGFSAYHFGLGKSSFITTTEKLDTKYCTYFNGEFAVPKSVNTIMPSFLYMRQSGNQEFIAGALIKILLGDPSTYTTNRHQRSIAFGGYYRYRDAIVPALLINYDTYALGVSYDINVSSLTPASKRNGGLELVLKYNLAPIYGVNLGRNDTKPSY